MTVQTPSSHSSRRMKRALALAAPAVALTLLAACGTAQSPSEPSDDGDGPASASEPDRTPEPTEVAARAPRIAVTYDGGVRVLDATTLEQVGDVSLEGFLRLAPAGDGRHVMVSTSAGFEVLDAGTWAQGHGDHDHYYTAQPHLANVVFSAQVPGHVVVNHGRTALFDDGTGEILTFDSADVVAEEREVREHTTPDAHHGVAVELSDGTLVVSQGDDDGRTGAVALDAGGEQIAATDQCPGLHGEAVAQGEKVVLGCEDGVLVFADGEFTKIDSPDDYGRIGNQAGSTASAVVLGDYKSDPTADLERPTQVALVNTDTGDLTLVELGTSYTFRSLATSAQGDALVLGTDGALHVIDPDSGEVTDVIEVLEPWEEPDEWQTPRPAVVELDGSVYVTDPATNSIHAVDLVDAEVWNSVVLDVTPNEITGVTGDRPEAGTGDNGDGDVQSGDDADGADEDDDEHEHDHDDHDHDHDHDDEHEDHDH